MKRLLLLAAAGAVAMPQTRTAFDVATIKLNETEARRNVNFAADTLTIVNLPLLNILIQAYDLSGSQISYAKFDAEFRQRYDIVAKAAHRVRRAEMQLMLQTLLAERFHLSLHHEEKLEQGYALIVDKDGSKLQAAAAPADEQDFEKRLGSDVQRQTIKFKNAGMPLVASLLMEQADTSRTRPGPPPRIVDMTGLKGGYDFTLEWDRPEPDADGVLPERLPALIGALRKVGLSLKSQKVPVDHVVIDHVDKAPTWN